MNYKFLITCVDFFCHLQVTYMIKVFAAYRAELIRWKWQNVEKKPNTLVDIFKPELYPYINRALKVYLTMSVTSATTERLFIALKRI